jgi:hypothetical protein
MSKKRVTLWRVAPLPGVAFAIQEIAKREQRSISNTVVKLVGEALDHRAREAAIRGEKDARLERLLKQMGSVCD